MAARAFGRPPAEQQHGRQQMEELALAIREYGRMRQEHYGSRSVLLGPDELAMRLRETTQTIERALGVLRDQGSAEETGTHGRWRLYFTVSEAQVRDRPSREVVRPPELRC